MKMKIRKPEELGKIGHCETQASTEKTKSFHDIEIISVEKEVYGYDILYICKKCGVLVKQQLRYKREK